MGYEIIFCMLQKLIAKSNKYIFSRIKFENNKCFYGLIVPLSQNLQIFSELNELHLPKKRTLKEQNDDRITVF